jgi:GH15 family glucan-1,4-alpha-glucosidase
MSLDLALVGNGTIGALVSSEGEVVWMCAPRFDGDPIFTSLLRGSAQPEHDGAFVIEMMNAVRVEQQYIADTPILVSRFFDAEGACAQVTDFAPRFAQNGKVVSPMMLVRKVEPVSGDPTIRVRLRPMQQYGARLIPPEHPSDGVTAANTNHIRYAGNELALRLTTDAPVDAIVSETPFALDHPMTLILGPDEEVKGGAAAAGTNFAECTAAWWSDWAGSLTVPTEWRNEVIRAAITLKLNASEDTGAIIAAMTTSIPEAPNSGRNWDYRYCWLRDAYFVSDALRRLGDASTTERYVDFVMRVAAGSPGAMLKPLYAIGGDAIPDEHIADHITGYRDMGPVRIGNQAYEQIQHDVYGEVILAALPLFLEPGNERRGEVALFRELEVFGRQASELFDKPDAGLWELRGKERVHTFSSVMCWAGCNALAGIAARLELEDRRAFWSERAGHIHQTICRRSWNARLGAFTAAMDGDTLDASLLLMHTLGFIAADDARFVSTVRAIGRDLRAGDFIYRYMEKDDFGRPENAFLVCTFWYIDALAAIGEREEARRIFGRVLSCRNRHGLLAEDLDPKTQEQWGNFVQTYSMAGIIQSALRLLDSPI